jgi:hypothetical protein
MRTLAMRAPSCTTLTVILRVPARRPGRVWQVPFSRASLWRGLHFPRANPRAQLPDIPCCENKAYEFCDLARAVVVVPRVLNVAYIK